MNKKFIEPPQYIIISLFFFLKKNYYPKIINKRSTLNNIFIKK